jgi:formylglycine-generating enzyme required for sulfatase activity
LIALAARVRPDSQALQDASKRIVEIRQRRASVLQAQADSALAMGDANRAQALLPQIDQAAPLSPEVQDLRRRIELTRTYGIWRPGQSFTEGLRTGGRGPEMIVVPVGEFRMGSPESEADHNANESPQHAIAFQRGFALSRNDITVAQFAQFVNATHYLSDAEKSGRSLIFDEAKNKLDPRAGVNWRHDFSGRPADPEQPAMYVSWNDATAYAAWLTRESGHVYRLPSEAEFEYALRAGTHGAYPWPGVAPPAGIGNLTGAEDVSPTGRHWGNAFAHYGDGYWGPSPVGRFPPNAFGLYDMIGNVSEWVQDCWHEGYRRAPQDGSAWMNSGCARHVVRGAAWSSAPEQARSAYRQPEESGVGNARLGFRVVREL